MIKLGKLMKHFVNHISMQLMSVAKVLIKQFDCHKAINNRAAEPWFWAKNWLKWQLNFEKIQCNGFSSEFNSTQAKILSLGFQSTMFQCWNQSKVTRITQVWALMGSVWFLVLSSWVTKIGLKITWLLDQWLGPTFPMDLVCIPSYLGCIHCSVSQALYPRSHPMEHKYCMIVLWYAMFRL